MYTRTNATDTYIAWRILITARLSRDHTQHADIQLPVICSSGGLLAFDLGNLGNDMYECGTLDWTVVGARVGGFRIEIWACVVEASNPGDDVFPSLDGTVPPTLVCPQDDRGGSVCISVVFPVEILSKSACIWSKSGKCQYPSFFSITVSLRDGGKVGSGEGWDGSPDA
jgi:hypothetical protein